MDLISNIIISEVNSGTFNFKSFYLRRFRRIVPAMLSTLVVTSGFAYLLLTPKAILDYSKLVLSSLFFYANFYLQNLDFYNAEPSKLNPLIHIWSLSVEEQFYILFPLRVFLQWCRDQTFLIEDQTTFSLNIHNRQLIYPFLNEFSLFFKVIYP